MATEQKFLADSLLDHAELAYRFAQLRCSIKDTHENRMIMRVARRTFLSQRLGASHLFSLFGLGRARKRARVTPGLAAPGVLNKR